jgi:gliding motility-associated-like protein
MKYVMLTIYTLCLILFFTHYGFSQCESISIDVNSRNFCVPAWVSYEALGVSSNDSLIWYINDTVVSNQVKFHEFYSDAQLLNIRLVIVNVDFNCTIRPDEKVAILALPEPKFELSNSLICELDNELIVYNKTPNTDQCIWVIDGSSYVSNKDFVNHKFVSVGRKHISLAVIDSFGCRGVTTKKNAVDVYQKRNIELDVSYSDSCVPVDVNFNLISNDFNDSVINSFIWSFPNSNRLFQEIKEPEKVTYNLSGNHQIGLKVETNYGCIHYYDKISSVSLGDSIELKFKNLDSKYCHNNIVNLELEDTTKIGNITWSIEGDNIYKIDSSLKWNRNISFNDTGWVSMKLINENNGCKSIQNFEDIFYVHGVKADFFSDNHFHCEVPHTVNLHSKIDSLSSDSHDLFWEISNGNKVIYSSKMDKVDLTFNDMGKYYGVKLTVKGNNGCTDVKNVPNFIYQLPLNLSQRSIPKIACLSQEVFFDNITKPSSYLSPDKFKWYYYDKDSITLLDSSFERNGKYTYQDTGFYHIQLIGSNGIGCRDTVNYGNVVEVIKPKIGLINNDSIICLGEFIDIKGDSKPLRANFRYNHRFIHNETNEIISIYDSLKVYRKILTPGVYDYYLDHRIENGCRDTFSQKIYVNGICAQIKVDTNNGCTPLTVNSNVEIHYNYDYNPTEIPNLNYRWETDKNSVLINDSSIENPKINFLEDDEYTIKLNLKNSFGCEFDTSYHTILTGIHAIFHEKYKRDTLCVGEMVEFVNQSENFPDSFYWNVDASSSYELNKIESNNAFFTFHDTGDISLKLFISRANSCFDTMVKNFYVSKVYPNFRLKDTLLICAPVLAQFESLSHGADSLFWDFGDGTKIVTTNKNSAHIYNKNSGHSKGFDIVLLAKSIHGCENQISKLDYAVVQGPVPLFNIDKYEGCSPLEVNYFDSSRDVSKILFKNGKDDIYYGEIKPSQIYENFRNELSYVSFYPELLVFDSIGCYASMKLEDSIRVYKSPEITLNNDVLNKVCIPYEYKGLLNSKYGKIWYWSFDSNTVISPNVSFEINEQSEKSFIAVARNEFDCFASINEVLMGFKKPILNFNIEPISCDNSKISVGFEIFPNSILNASINWEFEGDEIELSRSLNNHKKTIHFNSSGLKKIAVNFLTNEVCSVNADTSVMVYKEDAIPIPILNRVTFQDNYFLDIDYDAELDSRTDKLKLYRSDGYTQIIEDTSIKSVSNRFISKPGTALCYQISQLDICGTEGYISEPHCFVVPEVALSDPFELEVKWKHYVGFDSIIRYDIFRGVSSNQFNYIATVSGNINSFIDSMLCDSFYFYKIRAYSSDGRWSESYWEKNKPIYNYYSLPLDIDYVTVTDDDQIDVFWYPTSNPRHKIFEIQKYKENSNFPLDIIQLSSLNYTDANVDVNEFSYIYYVKDVDMCGYKTDLGLEGKSILLKGDYDQKAFLDWTAYEQWEMGVDRYYVFFDSLGTWSYLGRTAEDVLSFEDAQIRVGINDWYCYRVQGISKDDKKSFSNKICLAGDAIMHIPNAFTPNGDGLNDVFKPILHFVDYGLTASSLEMYTMVIYNRWGEIIFETHDPSIGWDGTYLNKFAQQDVYRYQVFARGIDKGRIYKKGTVTLLR